MTLLKSSKKFKNVIWVPQQYAVIASGKKTFIGTLGMQPCVALVAHGSAASMVAHFDSESVKEGDLNAEKVASQLLKKVGQIATVWIVLGDSPDDSSNKIVGMLENAYKGTVIKEKSATGHIRLSRSTGKLYQLAFSVATGQPLGKKAFDAIKGSGIPYHLCMPLIPALKYIDRI